MQEPGLYFVFVDLLLPFTWRNFELAHTFDSAAWTYAKTDIEFRRKYSSGDANYLPWVQNESDLPLATPFWISVTSPYAVEYDAEVFRKRFAPKAPSRLSATFAFGDLESCKVAAAKYGWNLSNVRQMKLVPDSLTRVHRVNMQVVSLARLAYKISSLDPNVRERLWKHYWDGGGNIELDLPAPGDKRIVYPSGEIWEFLIEGRLHRLDKSPAPS